MVYQESKAKVKALRYPLSWIWWKDNWSGLHCTKCLFSLHCYFGKALSPCNRGRVLHPACESKVPNRGAR